MLWFEGVLWYSSSLIDWHQECVFWKCADLTLSLRNLEPPEGDLHPHSQLRHESRHAQHADPHDARSSSGVSVWEDRSAGDSEPVPTPDENGPGGSQGEWMNKEPQCAQLTNMSSWTASLNPFLSMINNSIPRILYIYLFLTGLRHLQHGPPVHEPGTNQRPRPVLLVYHVAGQIQPLPRHGALLCGIGPRGPPV